MAVIGVDIGGTNVRAGLVDGGHLGLVSRRVHKQPPSGLIPYPTLLGDVLALIAELREHDQYDAVGISAAGTLSLDRSTVISTSQLDWVGQSLPRDVGAATGVPVVMENDGNCATWAEYVSGVGQGCDPFVLLTLGTGVGGGTVAGGRLIVGSDGFAGELGHICVETDSGLSCPCGAFGCLEQYASGRAMVGRYSAGPEGRYREAPGAPPLVLAPDRARQAQLSLARGLRSGESWAWRVVDDAATKIAIGLSAIVRVLDPPVLGIGGGAAGLGDPLLQAIRRAGDRYPGVEARKLRVRIQPAHHHEYAGLVGAALLASDRLGRPIPAGAAGGLRKGAPPGPALK